MALATNAFRRRPVSERLNLGSLGMHVLAWQGEGLPIIMLHGWLDQSWTFAWLAEHLPQRLLAWDARGYGQTDWAADRDFYHFFDYLRDLRALLTELKLSRVILLGHSMGGMIASMYAGTFPEQVAALINLEGWIVPDAPVDAGPERVRVWLEQLSSGKDFRPLADLDAAAERLQRQDPRLSAEQVQVLAQTGTRSEGEQLIWRHDPRHRMRSPQPFRLDQTSAFWQRIACPILLAYGEHSEALKLPDWHQRLALFPGAELLLIKAAGHNLHLHQPEQLGLQISDWLQRAEITL